MEQTAATTGEQLSNALQALGIHFILGGRGKDAKLHKQPARLMAALAGSSEARLRLSLVPLFLEHPEFAAHVRAAADSLEPGARLTLQCYYSAAVWLGKRYQVRGKPLPDHFSSELGVQVTNDPKTNLERLARRHQELSGARVNWLGTYQHAAQVWLRGVEHHRACP